MSPGPPAPPHGGGRGARLVGAQVMPRETGLMGKPGHPRGTRHRRGRQASSGGVVDAALVPGPRTAFHTPGHAETVGVTCGEIPGLKSPLCGNYFGAGNSCLQTAR